MAEAPRHQLASLERVGVSITVGGDGLALPPADLIIDAIIGYSLRGAPTGAAASLIRAASAQNAPVLALDVPSGVDTASGAAFEPSIRATATLTLALPKVGLRSEQARDRVGELYLGDISVPNELYAGPRLNLDVGPLFAEDDVIRVW
jgi:NAD(P)H-hydrate epimerase